jgi:non-canonical purine NTP pyrophosphatase (RdgB/HAM1 family)
MARRFESGKLVIASHNPGKVREIKALLDPFGAEVISASDLALPEPEETGDTFIANAKLKAHAAAVGSNLPALSDDSGIVVNGLGGKPGIYSARWGGPKKDFNRAMARVWKELGTVEDKSAHFTSALDTQKFLKGTSMAPLFGLKEAAKVLAMILFSNQMGMIRPSVNLKMKLNTVLAIASGPLCNL